MTLIGTHGRFEREADGRMSGTVLTVNYPRRDGKFPVEYAFGSGARIRKLYTPEQCRAAVAKLGERTS